MTQTITDVKSKIRDVVNFPKPGIIFRDITTALKDPETLKVMIDYLCDEFKDIKIDYIAGIESRGFIFGMPMAYKMNAGFVPIRKPKNFQLKHIHRNMTLNTALIKLKFTKTRCLKEQMF